MRIFYESHGYKYFLEPVFGDTGVHQANITGCQLYDTFGVYKGFWEWRYIPSETRLHIRAEIKRFEKERSKVERLNAVRGRTRNQK